MKKLILSVSAVAGLSLAGYAQGIALQDNSTSASANGYDTTIGGVINTADLNLELLIGSSTPNTPVVTLLLSVGAPTTSNAPGQISSAIGDMAAGYIYDPSSLAYTVSAFAGQTVNAQIEAWTGQFSSYAAAEASGQTGVYGGLSQIFTAAIPSTSTGFAADVSGMGVINLTQVPTTVIPEPSTLAMAGVGLASMLFLRRKTK